MNLIQQFYSGEEADFYGRRIEDIWAWDDERLESIHDYIQWLFPSRRRSDFNPDAPLLTDADIAAFRASPALQKRLLRSFRRMLTFYGFQAIEQEDVVVIERSQHWRDRFPTWLTPGNHNHLRLTRIIACLRCLGLGEYSRAFLGALEEVRRDFPCAISARTGEFWQSAGR